MNQPINSACSASSFANILGELMAKYDAFRGMWIDEFGSDDGFDAWFTSKALPPSHDGEIK